LPAFDTVRRFLEQHETLVWAVAAGSAGLLIFSLLALPLVALLLPTDFITRKLDPSPEPRGGPGWFRRHPILRWTLRVLKNLAGVVLAVAGLAMLVLPGQGLLTLALALLLLDLPGKQKLEARVLRSPRLLRLINNFRRRFGRPALTSGPNPPSPLSRPHIDQTIRSL
jgi:hypothetical protein